MYKSNSDVVKVFDDGDIIIFKFGRDQFIIVHEDDDVLNFCLNYVLYEKQKFCFRQFAPIYNKSTDLYDNLRIVPHVNDTITGRRLEFLYLVSNIISDNLDYL